MEKIREKIELLIDERKWHELADLLATLHPSEIVKVIHYLDSDEKIIVFRLLRLPKAVDVISELDYNDITWILKNLKTHRIVKILSLSPSDDAADIVENLPDDMLDEVLQRLPYEERREIIDLVRYGGETAGGIMAKEFVAVDKDKTVKDALDILRKNKEKIKEKGHDEIRVLFVVDQQNTYCGAIALIDLIVAEPDTLLSEIMDTDYPSVDVFTDQEEVADLFRRYDIVAIPVVDSKNRLLGRITVDDIIDIIDEEASEDMFKMVGVHEEERVFTPLLLSLKRRLPWFLLNIITASLSASVVGFFQPTIKDITFIAVLMPIVAGVGGNRGTQTITIIIRSLALNEMELKDVKRALIKEILIGIFAGILVGGTASLVVYLFKGNYMLGIVLFLAIVGNMILAGILGVGIPLLFKLLRLDPALASGIFLTMCTDAGGFFLLLFFANIFLR